MRARLLLEKGVSHLGAAFGVTAVAGPGEFFAQAHPSAVGA
jgi:hypothetical protein